MYNESLFKLIVDVQIPYEEEEGGEWEDIAEEPNLLHLQTLFERSLNSI